MKRGIDFFQQLHAEKIHEKWKTYKDKLIKLKKMQLTTTTQKENLVEQMLLLASQLVAFESSIYLFENDCHLQVPINMIDTSAAKQYDATI